MVSRLFIVYKDYFSFNYYLRRQFFSLLVFLPFLLVMSVGIGTLWLTARHLSVGDSDHVWMDHFSQGVLDLADINHF